jgi:hypothetical protein
MSIYRISAAASVAQTPPNSAPGGLDSLDDCDKRLHEWPLHAEIWLERGQRFLTLNYPELAASDAHKALLLADALCKDEEDVTSEHLDTRRTLLRDACRVLVQALIDCHCEAQAFDTAEQAFKKTNYEVFKQKAEYLRGRLQRKKLAIEADGGATQEQEDKLQDGCVRTVEYPWIEKRHYTRSPELVTLINEELKRTSGGTGPRCYVYNSTLLPGSSDMLGMFAARDFQPGECILTDRTATGVCSTPAPDSCSNCYIKLPSSPTMAHCCATSFCSIECHDLALTTYHRVLCGQDFTWLTQPARNITHNASPLRPLLMLRFLAICIQAGPENHPLDDPLIARLQAMTEKGHVDVFTLKESIVTPIDILRQLGVNFLTNHNFDTMVLHTIWTRLANNKAGEPDRRLGYVDLITPHLPLFNHSCDPNVHWEREEGSTTVSFFAKRRIEKGQELFCSYLGDGVRFMESKQRWERLWPWFEGPCLCGRCQKEGRAQ